MLISFFHWTSVLVALSILGRVVSNGWAICDGIYQFFEFHFDLGRLDLKHVCFLVATQLISLIVDHYDALISNSISILSKIHLYTDSKSMIDKLNAMDMYPAAHLKTVMDLEWDILQALQSLMKELNEISNLNRWQVTNMMTW